MAGKSIDDFAVPSQSNEGIDRAITQYLNTPMPSQALLLRGPWGVGKSFYWRQFTNRCMPKGLQDITFSVAGLSTLEELDRGLFLASISGFGTGPLQETGALLGRALLRWAKVEPADVKLKADMHPDRTVIALDDLERFGGEFKVLFGFILGLLDESHVHVILIADEGRALVALPGYRDHRERIVARAFDVAPAVATFYDYVANGYREGQVRAALLDARGIALTLFEGKRLQNLRTVRAILDDLQSLLAEARWEHGHNADVRQLLSAITFHFMAVAKDPSNAQVVSRAFLQRDLGTILALHRSELDRKKGKERQDEIPTIYDLIVGLGFETDAFEWPMAPAFAAYVLNGGYDPQAIADEFSVFGVATTPNPSLLKKFRHYRSMQEREFREAVEQLYEMLSQNRWESVQEIWEMYSLMRHLAKQRLIRETAEHCTAQFMEKLRAYEPGGDVKVGLEVWTDHYEADEVALLSKLQELDQRLRTEAKKDADKQQQQSIITGTAQGDQEITTAIFCAEDPSAILAQLSEAGRPAFNRMTQFFRRRLSISNIADFAAADAPFSRALATRIRQTLPAGQLTLDQAEMDELARTLIEFAERVAPEERVAQATRGAMALGQPTHEGDSD